MELLEGEGETVVNSMHRPTLGIKIQQEAEILGRSI